MAIPHGHGHGHGRLWARGDLDWGKPYPGSRYWYVLMVTTRMADGSMTSRLGTFTELQPTQPNTFAEGRTIYSLAAGPFPTFDQAEGERRRLDAWLMFRP